MSNDLELPGSTDEHGEIVKVRSVMTEAAAAREAAEVQAAMVIAKRFPRDDNSSVSRILTACKRIGLAERAIYAYPRGGTTVTGPSIRLAECLSQNWGNIDFGIKELDNSDGVSTVMSYAWDLETNSRSVRVFSVKHWRDTKSGGYEITDQRDIYEMVANQGARRLRACILAILPGDVVEAAVNACKKTMAGQSNEPIIDRARKMVEVFKEYGVTIQMIERRLGHKLDAIVEPEMVTLRGIYTSIKDGAASREQYFDLEAEQNAEAAAAPMPTGRTRTKKKPAEEAPKAAAAPETKPAAAETVAPPAEAKPEHPEAEMRAADLKDLIEQADTQEKLTDAGAKIKAALEVVGPQRHSELLMQYQAQYRKVHNA